MPKLPPPPVIEGTLKEPIYAMSFGILVSMWSVNIGSLLTPYYFTYIVSIVFAFECVLWFLDKPRQDYEVYKPPLEESRRQETPVATPASEKSGGERSSKVFDDGTKAKKTGARSPVESGEGKSEKTGRFRFRKGKNADQSPQSPAP